MNIKNLNTLKKEIYFNFNEKLPQIYNSIQSLYEYIGKEFLNLESISLRSIGYSSNKRGAAIIIGYINDYYIKSWNFKNIFKKLNEKANTKKHPGDEDSPLFDEQEIKKNILTYNSFAHKLMAINRNISIEFILDESLLYKGIAVSASNPDSTNFIAIEKQKSRVKKQKDIVKKEKLELKNLNSNSDITEVADKKLIVFSNYDILKAEETEYLNSLSKMGIIKRKFFIKYEKDCIKINCGNGKQDHGFYIRGVKKMDKCENEFAPIYAIIYNFLQRNSDAQPSTFIKDFEQLNRISFNYSNIFRYQMIILQLIKNNYIINHKLPIELISGSKRELQLAFDDIINYCEMISQLTGIKFIKPELIIGKNNTPISLTISDETVHTKNIDRSKKHNYRDIWHEDNIKYQVSSSHEKIMQVFLKEFFGFDSFKPGQFQAICKVLSAENNAICILPTGGGKSLIYYLVALLSPSPTIIVSPTELLIHDQIRNLKLFHGIDDVTHISPGLDYSDFILSNKLIFITPSAFQDHSLIYKIIDINVSRRISNLILDEIHTISNWSHDFRPDYLMLSFNILTFLDKTKLFGFTATANYKVLADILTQLKLDKDTIISPIDMSRDDIKFKFYNCEDNDSISKKLNNLLEKFDDDNNRALIFTKTKDSSNLAGRMISNKEIKYRTDIFNSQDTISYYDFIGGDTKFLIADSDIGVGINLPNIEKIIHFGFPVSKGQYVQEVGRSGRNGEQSNSYVLFKGISFLDKDEQKLISFNTSIDEVLSIVERQSNYNDVANAFKRIIGHVENPMKCVQNIIEVYNQLKSINNYTKLAFIIDSEKDYYKEINKFHLYLYTLFRVGIIYNWYIINISPENGMIELFVEVDHNKDDLSYVKKKTIEYLHNLGKFEKNVYDIKQSTTIENIIYLYEDWYYQEFLYHHREQLLNMIQFLEYYYKKENQHIIEDLKNYFSISIVDVENEMKEFKKASISEIMDKAIEKIDTDILANIIKGLESGYNFKLDLILFMSDLISRKTFDHSRFKRILDNLKVPTFREFMENLHIIYSYSINPDRLFMFNALTGLFTIKELIDNIYMKCENDIIYYGLLANFANKVFEGEEINV